MSEREPQAHGHENHAERAEGHAEQQEKLKQLIEKAAETNEKSPHEVERLTHDAKEKAISGKERPVGDLGKESGKHSTLVIDKTVKNQAYKKTLKHVQRQLPRSQRTFSKFIHQDTIEKISEVSGKTIARPSGLLGSGVFAFLGTTVVVWVSRHYGFRYNFFTFVVFVLFGFMVGLCAEFILNSGKKLLRRS